MGGTAFVSVFILYQLITAGFWAVAGAGAVEGAGSASLACAHVITVATSWPGRGLVVPAWLKHM